MGNRLKTGADQQHAELDANGSTRMDWPLWVAEKTQLLFSHRFWSSGVFLLFLAAVLLGVCLIRAYIGIATMRASTPDVFIFLDGGWRLLNGQIPNRDFYSELGPFMHLLTALGLTLAHGGGQGFGYAQAIMAGALGIWAYGLSASRLTPATRALLCITVVLLAIAPYIAGYPVTQTNPACTYNRYGYALIGLAMIEALCRPEQGRGSEFRGGLSTGIIAGLLPFVKISYFLGIGFLLLVLFPCRTQTPRRWAGIAAGFGAVITGFWVFLGGSFVPIFNDWRELAGARHIEWPWYLVEVFMAGIVPMLMLVFLAVLLLRDAGRRTEARSIGIAGLATTAMGAFFVLTNYQKNSLPLNGFFAIILLSIVTSHNDTSRPLHFLFRCATCWWSVIIVLSLVSLDAGALMYGLKERVRFSPSTYMSFDSPRLAAIHSSETLFVERVNDGLSLVAKFRQQNDTVMSLDFCNPFSFGLGMKPARGGAVALCYRINFDETHGPSPERLMGQANLVAVPKRFTNATLDESVPRIYGPYLKDHFRLIGESTGWRLYRLMENPVRLSVARARGRESK